MLERMTRRDLGRTLDRRTFMKALGALGVGAAAGGTLLHFARARSTEAGDPLETQTRMAMGTYVSVTAVHASREHANDAIEAAYDEMDRLVGILSRHRSSTALSVLNAMGRLSSPPPELVDVLKQSLHLQGVTRGAFDVTVGPLIDLFEQTLGRDGHTLPDDSDIAEALERVGSDKIIVTPTSVRFRARDMSITLDGIAKGYIVDRMSDALSAHGVDTHLVNAGGDIRVRGTGHKWTVAVEDPKKMRNYPDVVRMTGGAVATSGSYEIYYDSKKVFHHIVDPQTGRSPHTCESATVRATTAMEADALSTATFVLGPVAGLRFIERLSDRECLVVTGAGDVLRSRGWLSATAV